MIKLMKFLLVCCVQSGKIREATRFITQRMESGGVMMPTEDAIKPAGKTVLEVLKMKHPNQVDPHPDAFIESRICLL